MRTRCRPATYGSAATGDSGQADIRGVDDVRHELLYPLIMRCPTHRWSPAAGDPFRQRLTRLPTLRCARSFRMRIRLRRRASSTRTWSSSMTSRRKPFPDRNCCPAMRPFRPDRACPRQTPRRREGRLAWYPTAPGSWSGLADATRFSSGSWPSSQPRKSERGISRQEACSRPSSSRLHRSAPRSARQRSRSC